MENGRVKECSAYGPHLLCKLCDDFQAKGHWGRHHFVPHGLRTSFCGDFAQNVGETCARTQDRASPNCMGLQASLWIEKDIFCDFLYIVFLIGRDFGARFLRASRSPSQTCAQVKEHIISIHAHFQNDFIDEVAQHLA